MKFALSFESDEVRPGMPSLKYVWIAVIALVLCVPAVSAQPKNGGRPLGPGRMGGQARPGPRGAKALERLSNMPPGQRERTLQRLPPERRERVERQLEQYNRMSPEERDRLHRQVEAFQALPPERQEMARRAFRRYNNLPPERQGMLRDELQSLRQLSPEERNARFSSDDFRGKFRPGEQQLLQDLVEIPQP